MAKLSDYVQQSGGISLYALGVKPFSIIDLNFGSYEGKPNVTITTKENYKGSDLKLSNEAKQNMSEEELEQFPSSEHNVFHTNREAIVGSLKSEELIKAVKSGEPVGPVRCKYVDKPKKGGKPYWILEDVE